MLVVPPVGWKPGAAAGLAFERVIATATSTTNNTTVSCTIPAGGVAAGRTVVVVSTHKANTGAAPTCADSRGNTYAVIRSAVENGHRACIFRATLATALQAGDTITVTQPENDNRKTISAYELSGTETTYTSGEGHGTSSSSTNPTATTEASIGAGAIAFGAVLLNDDDPFTPPDGWSEEHDYDKNPVHTVGYKANVSGAVTYNPATAGDGFWVAVVAAFR